MIKESRRNMGNHWINLGLTAVGLIVLIGALNLIGHLAVKILNAIERAKDRRAMKKERADAHDDSTVDSR